MKFIKKNWYIILINLILIVGVFVFNTIYLHNWSNGIPGSIRFKFISSACFATLGIVNLIFSIIRKKTNLMFSIFTTIALVLCMTGDIAIEYEFIAGAALFALGHVAFIVSFFFLKKFHWVDILTSAILMIPAALLIIFLDNFTFNPELLRYVCAIYALIIGFMFGKSLSNLIRERTKLNICLFIAALLFVISDFFLLLELFTNLDTVSMGLSCMAIYCPALVMMASLVYFRE